MLSKSSKSSRSSSSSRQRSRVSASGHFRLFFLFAAFCCCCCSCCVAADGNGERIKTFQEIRNDINNCGMSHFDDTDTATDDKRQSSTGKRIVGGRRSRSGEWPWLVSLRNRNHFLAKIFRDTFAVKVLRNHYCGAVLIHPRWLLSARHCFSNHILDKLSRTLQMDLELNTPSDWSAILGEHDINSVEGNEHEVAIKKIFLAPKRKFGECGDSDLALLQLKRPVKINKFVRPACLPSSAAALAAADEFEEGVADFKIPAVGEVCVVAGWGKRNVSDSQHSAQLYHAKVQIHSNSDCGKAYNEPGVSESDSCVLNSEICAAGVDYNADSCHFDSGGPLMCREGNRWVASGIVSRGKGCAARGFPGIYAGVAHNLNWIADIIYQHQF